MSNNKSNLEQGKTVDAELHFAQRAGNCQVIIDGEDVSKNIHTMSLSATVKDGEHRDNPLQYMVVMEGYSTMPPKYLVDEVVIKGHFAIDEIIGPEPEW